MFTKYQPFWGIHRFREDLLEADPVSAGANLSVTDMRRAARHPVDFPVIAEHRRLGDLQLHVANISAHGFMVDNGEGLQRGDRVIIRLPVVGRIEAYVIWSRDERAGFQFERIIRLDDFLAIIDELQPNPRLRRLR
ncbi:MAG: PilZ domain-containing protein [Sphingomonadales bacterium]|nr:MAG: PilZ domain-containing protein [Sphingomonadales bacterium]